MRINWSRVFGELILIVAGILIALYINNLNEERKERIFERKITSEIKASLESDSNFHLASRIERGKEIMRSTDIVLSFLTEEMEYHDSLRTHFWKMNWIIIFEPQTIPFERLKSRGIELIFQEDIRINLLEIYDSRYPRLSYFTEGHNEWTVNRVEAYCLKNFEIQDLDWGKGYRPLDIESLRNDIEYQNIVIEKRARTSSLTDRIINANERVKDLIELL